MAKRQKYRSAHPQQTGSKVTIQALATSPEAGAHFADYQKVDELLDAAEQSVRQSLETAAEPGDARGRAGSDPAVVPHAGEPLAVGDDLGRELWVQVIELQQRPKLLSYTHLFGFDAH